MTSAKVRVSDEHNNKDFGANFDLFCYEINCIILHSSWHASKGILVAFPPAQRQFVYLKWCISSPVSIVDLENIQIAWTLDAFITRPGIVFLVVAYGQEKTILIRGFYTFAMQFEQGFAITASRPYI